MTLSEEQREEIKIYLRKTIKEKISKYKRESKSMPFLSRIIQDEEKVASYSFLQSIATTLGMSIYEQISVIISKPYCEEAKRNVKLNEKLSSSQKQTISKIVSELRNRERTVDREKEVKEVLKANPDNGKNQNENKTVDFYMKKEGKEFYFEIKTVKPNIDVFTKSKQKLLEWVARKQKPINAILAFPYNPYYPEPYLRFTEQGVVEHKTEFLIAEEYWDFLGGKGTYEELLKIFDEVGKEFKDKIQSKIKEVAEEKIKS